MYRFAITNTTAIRLARKGDTIKVIPFAILSDDGTKEQDVIYCVTIGEEQISPLRDACPIHLAETMCLVLETLHSETGELIFFLRGGIELIRLTVTRAFREFQPACPRVCPATKLVRPHPYDPSNNQVAPVCSGVPR